MFTSHFDLREVLFEAPIRALCALGVAAVSILAAVPGQAQTYPVKTIHMIVPFPPAGAVDILARSFSNALANALGQSIVVENRTGAGGVIGSELVAKAAPDGYTLLTSSASTHSIAPAMMPKLPYDATRDFTAIVNIGEGRSILVVSAGSPWKNMVELITYVKAHPGETNYASAGVGTIAHLNNESFVQAAGLQMVHVPYKGTALAVPDLLSGRITLMVDSLTSAMPNIVSGKERALAISGSKRLPALPNIPMYSEAGLPDYHPSGAYQGMWGPAGMPAAIVTRLNAESNKVLQTPELRAQLAKFGIEPVGGTAREFADTVRQDVERWSEVIRRGGIKPQ